MSIATTTPDTNSYRNDPAYARGRADAYDDAHTLTLDALKARAAEYAEHAHLFTALGYMDRVLEMRMEEAAVAAAETELAWFDWETDLKRQRARRAADRLRAFFARTKAPKP